jgi:hypothetical protein
VSTDWHVPDEELRRYARRALAPPALWSTEAHLAACPGCRERLTAAVDPAAARAGWIRLETELDAPVPGPVERLLLRAGVADHTARLLAATPVLRLSWLAAVASTLALTALVANLADPVVFLVIAPLLPLVGVAASFGPAVDPTYEIALVSPLHTFHLLMLRCVAVVSTTTVLSALASLALPEYGLVALGWFLPALVLTLFSLVLTPRLGPFLAAGAVGAGWLALIASTLGIGAGASIVFAAVGQCVAALAGALAAVAIVRLRPAFETSRHIDRAPLAGARRIP